MDDDEALEDIARLVGHARPATTAGHVKRLGRRPHAVAQRAAAILDGEDEGQADDDSGVRDHPDDFGSDGSGPTVPPSDGAGA